MRDHVFFPNDLEGTAYIAFFLQGVCNRWGGALSRTRALSFEMILGAAAFMWILSFGANP